MNLPKGPKIGIVIELQLHWALSNGPVTTTEVTSSTSTITSSPPMYYYHYNYSWNSIDMEKCLNYLKLQSI